MSNIMPVILGDALVLDPTRAGEQLAPRPQDGTPCLRLGQARQRYSSKRKAALGRDDNIT
jgi:hypothetical protein